MKRFSPAVAGLLGLVLMGGLLPARAELEISDAWVRALPPVQRSTAAYLTLRNSGPQALEVSGGSAALAQRVEIHRSEMADGMMRMRQVSSLRLAPGETLQLAPGGVHLMLLGLSRMPDEGEQLELCLQAGAAGTACTSATVRREAEARAHHHH
ncbi:MAG: copper chaperone PCu(A)C [Parahaliea sp.]